MEIVELKELVMKQQDQILTLQILVQTLVDELVETGVVKDKEPGRNERVMLQGPNGEMEFVKSKKVDSYLQKGWNLI